MIRLALILLILPLLQPSEEIMIPPGPFEVMTYNVHFQSDEHSWREREKALHALLEQPPDILAIQEGQPRIEQSIRSALGDDWTQVHHGRAPTGIALSNVIYVADDRFTVLDSYRIDLPAKRFAVVAVLRDNDTEAEITVLNTHFTAYEEGAKTRQYQAETLADQFNPETPYIILGDFNEDHGGEASIILHRGFPDLRNTWNIAQMTGPKYGTWGGYDDPSTERKQLDWLLVSQEFRVPYVHVDTFAFRDLYPSDHFPVRSEVFLP